MLDWAHDLALRGVAKGIESGSSLALDDLVAAGLVVRDPSGDHRVTEAGEAALAAGEPSRLERIALPMVAVAGIVFVASTVLEWLT